MRFPLFYLLSFLFLGFSAPSIASSLHIVTSIKPLAFIVKEIALPQDKIEVLLPDNASPHVYGLKPSNVKSIEQANLVVWVGPELEIFLEKLLRQRSNTLTLLDLKGLELIHYAKAEQHEGDHHNHKEASVDPHIWLGPRQVKTVAKAIAQALSERNPENSQEYQKNLSRFTKQLDEAFIALMSNFVHQGIKGYFSFHNAYAYFERSFGLAPLGHLTLNPEIKPGAKTIIEIHQKLKENRAACVFYEPQFNAEIVEKLVHGTQATMVSIDPLAKELSLSKDSYFDFFANLGGSFLSCFKH